MSTNTLDDLDAVRNLASRIDCLPTLTARPWISTRALKSPNGQLMMLNNYQDDPWVGQLFEGKRVLFGGKVIQVAARSGVILALNWRLDDHHVVEWSTAEVREIVRLPRSIKVRWASEGYVKIRTVKAHKSSTALHAIDKALTTTL